MSGLYFTGLGSGIDTDAMVRYLTEIERQPLQTMAAQKKELQGKRSCWQEIQSRLTALQDVVGDLQTGRLYGQKKVIFERDGVAAGAATSAAAKGSYKIQVTALARAHSVASATISQLSGDPAAEADSALGLAGSLKINGREITVAEDDSLEQIRQRLSGLKDAKVTASIIDGRLVLTAEEAGAANSITWQGELAGSFGFQTVQHAGDAALVVNGLQVTRPGNVIDDLLPGVSLRLLRAGEEPFTLTVSDDHSALIGKAEDFVRQYNSVYQFAKAQLSLDSATGSKGALYADSSLGHILMAVRRIVTGALGTQGNRQNLASLGISTAAWNSSEAEGTLVLDRKKLEAVLDRDPEMAAEVLGGETGLAGRLADYLGGFLRGGEGLIDSRTRGIESRIKDLDQRAARLEQRLEKREQTLRSQFLTAERLVGQMNSQGLWLEQQVGLLSQWTVPGKGSR